MSWADLHSRSERLAIEAEAALREFDKQRAIDLYRQAAVLEQQALNEIEPEKARTRGITAVSAVALWFKGAEYVAAERLAYGLLSDLHTPEFARAELRSLVQAIWTESTKLEAGTSFIPGQVMVSVKGGEVVTGGAPLDLIVDKVQTIQSIFYRTIEFLNGTAHRKAGRPAKELQDACRPWLFQAAPGSYQFSVAIQKPVQQDFFKSTIEPERIAHHFLEIVAASTGDDSSELVRLVPDDQYRSTFLKLSRNLTPAGKTYDRIEFRAPGEPRPVVLGRASRQNINEQLRPLSMNQIDNSEDPAELRGVLRAVHLDQDWIDVVVDGNSVHIEGLQDAVDDVIGPMVNRLVIVRVLRGRGKKRKFVDIELAD